MGQHQQGMGGQQNPMMGGGGMMGQMGQMGYGQAGAGGGMMAGMNMGMGVDMYGNPIQQQSHHMQQQHQQQYQQQQMQLQQQQQQLQQQQQHQQQQMMMNAGGDPNYADPSEGAALGPHFVPPPDEAHVEGSEMPEGFEGIVRPILFSRFVIFFNHHSPDA